MLRPRFCLEEPRLVREHDRLHAVLLPASMKLLGDWNWYLPSWLQWLPARERRADVEPSPASA